MLFNAGFWDRVRHAALITFTAGGFAVLANAPLQAASSISLAWNPSTGTNIAGYRIHYGGASRNYTNMVTASAGTAVTVSGLKDGTTYYFAATAYDTSGLESDFSNEAVGATPAPANQPPTLNSIANVTLNEDAGAQNVTLSGISSGSTNESQTLTVTATSDNAALIPNPSITYTSPNATASLTFAPVANGFGTATITVTVNDGGASNNVTSQSFTVTVNPVNDPPTLNALSNLAISENAGAQTVSLAGISSGAANESQTLVVTATSSNPSLIPNPTVSYASPAATGSLVFTPVAFAFGSATITVTVNDGGAANSTVTRTFTVTVNPVNQAPTLNALANVTLNENASAQTVSLSGISSGAANEADTLTVTATSSNPSIIPNPTVSYTSPNATGSISFTPVANAFGAATVTVTVNDGGTSNNVVSRTFTVTVNPVNQAPTLNALANVTINENASAQTVSLSGISSGAANEADTLTVTATSSNPSVVPNPTVSYTSPNATGSLSFTPIANAFGAATVTVTVNDGGTSNNVVSRTFTVSVNPVNQAPTLNALANVTINENASAQTVSLSGISSGAANEADTLTVTATSSNPSIIPNPTVTYTSPNATGSLSFTPVANAFGAATVTVTVNDGGTSNNVVSRTFTVTVNPVNQAPTLNALANVTINENASSQTVSLSGISSGAANEADTLTVTATSSNPSIIPNPTVTYTSPNATGSLSFTPVANAFGAATVTVTVNDGGTSNNVVSRTFTVTVNPVNQAPTLNALANVTINENASVQTVSLSGISSGATNETQTLTITAASSNPALIPNPTVNYTSPNATGTLTFTPATDVSGTATITVTVDDGQSANHATSRSFTVLVNAVNSAPTLSPIANITVNENAGAQTVGLAGISSGSASELQTLTVTATSSNPSLIPNPVVSYTSPNTTGSLAFTPAGNLFGSATVTVTVNDGGASNNVVSRTFTVTVNPVNQAPTLNALANVTINENAGQQSVALSGISSGAANETQTLSVSAVSSNPSLIPNPVVNYTSPNATGSVAFTPAANQSGSATLTVTVNDGGASNNIVTRSFAVTVSPVNQTPTLDPIANVSLDESAGKQTISLTGISSGAANENQTLSVTATSSNPGLIPTPAISYTSPAATGSLSFQPVAYASGSANIVVTVNDGGASNNVVSRTFTVTVKAINQPPSISQILDQSTAQDTATAAIPFTIGDIETAASNLVVSATSDNPALVPTNNIVFGGSESNRTVTITPSAGQNGTAAITVVVSDGEATASTTFQLNIASSRPVNTAPTITSIPDQTVNQNTATAPLPFTIADVESAVEDLALSASSSDTNLVPLAGILFGGSGSNRTVTVTPTAGLTGTAAITITVDDGLDTSSSTFNVSVVAPTNSAAPNLTLTVVGNGKVTPDLTSQKLTVGRSYSVTATPAPGQAFAGWSGSISSTASRLTFVLKSNFVLQATFVPVSVVTRGKGSISPNLATSQTLLVGKAYTISAIPASGQVFAGWSGSVTSSAARISFVVTPNAVVQATFVDNPYIPVQGNYSGLFHEEDAVRPYSAGSFTVTVTSGGGYSGSLLLAGKKIAFSGKLDLELNGASQFNVNGATATLKFQIGTGDRADEIFGTLASDSWTAGLQGDRKVYGTPKGLTAAPAGVYTLILPGQSDDPSKPGGDGYGTVRVSTAGVATFSGTLADGTSVSQTAQVSKNGEWPFFISLYSGNGCIMSWISFTNDVDKDLSGLFAWIKPAISNAAFYPAGFTYDFEGAGSAYQAPTNALVHILSLTNTAILFSGGNLAADFTNAIVIGNSSKVTNLGTNKLSLTFSLTAGTFAGSVVDPNNRITRSFGGAVFQKQNVAFGLLRGTNETSQVVIGEP